jgi:hypothetical protein
MLFVAERRRSRRLASAIRAERAPASGAINTALACLSCALGSISAIWSDQMIRMDN